MREILMTAWTRSNQRGPNMALTVRHHCAGTLLVLAAFTRSASGYGGGGGRGGWNRDRDRRDSGGGGRGGRGGRGPQFRPRPSGPATASPFDDNFAEEERGAASPVVVTGDALYGVSPVLSALRTGRREFHKLWLQESLDTDKRSDRPALREIETLAHAAGVRYSLPQTRALTKCPLTMYSLPFSLRCKSAAATRACSTQCAATGRTKA